MQNDNSQPVSMEAASFLGLPEGRLARQLGEMLPALEDVEITVELTLAAAEILVARGDTDGLTTQAEVIARASEKYGFGDGFYQVRTW